jgi:predicted AAA+ superfamily ATPase
MIVELEEALAYSRVVNLIGPRQVGKTTLVRDLFDKGEFLTLDDTAVLEAINADAAGLLAARMATIGKQPLIIDEAQRSKALALAIKRIVDKDRRKGQFILTGSSNIFAAADVADSLAGRVLTLKLWPLTVSEAKHRSPAKWLNWAIQKTPSLDTLPEPEVTQRTEYIRAVLAGGYPEIRELPIKPRQRQYRAYVDTVVERDVADVLPIRKTDALRRLIDQMAARTSAEINISSLSSVLQIQRQTVEQYLDVLGKLSMVTKLGHWASGEGKREIKNAKYHFVDTGIACALRRFTADTFDIGANPTALGSIMESFIFNEIQRSLPFQEKEFKLYHWRNRDKREIDILADADTHLVGIEVKTAATVSNNDFRHMKWFAKEGPGKSRTMTSVIFYLGEHKLSFGDRCFALPVSTMWSQ